MEEIYFGITVNPGSFPAHVDVKELIALLFVAPNITVEQIKKIISEPTNVRFNQLEVSVRSKISEVLEIQGENEEELVSLYADKINKWSRCFGIVSEEELDYVEKQFSLKKSLFLQQIRRNLFNKLKTPKSIAEYIGRYIKGQDEAIRRMSIPFFNHFMRVQRKMNPPQNAVCIIGGTGVGKTETTRRFSELMNVATVRVNLGSVVPNGIVGSTIGSQILSHVQDEAHIDKYKNAILHFSEFDKLAQRNMGRIHYGIDIQKELLAFFDRGTSINLSDSKGASFGRSNINLPVDGLLICFDGAFVGIEQQILKRLQREGKVSQHASPENRYLMSFLTSEDLVDYGVMPELASRIGQLAVMNPLSIENLYNILVHAEESEIATHKLYCEERGFSLEFTDGALMKISEIAYASQLGARSLARILNSIMEDVYYDHLPYQGKTLLVDTDFVERQLFYKEFGRVLTEYEKDNDVDSLAKKHGMSTDEIINIIITHTQYKH